MTLAAAIGAAVGVASGFLLGELFGEFGSHRVRKAVGLRRPRKPFPEDEAGLEREVTEVLDANPTTRRLGIRALAVGNGVVELLGTAPDETERELAANLVRNNTSAPVVVNRILVEGVEVPLNGRVSAS